MAEGKLVFLRPADGTGHLVFNDSTDAPTAPSVEITVDGVFADDMASGTVQLLWDANVSRGERAEARTRWESAEAVGARIATTWQPSTPVSSRTASGAESGARVLAALAVAWQSSERFNARTGARWQDGTAQREALNALWQEASRLRGSNTLRWQDGAAEREALNALWQEAVRLRNTAATRWQDGDPRQHRVRHRSAGGHPIRRTAATRWQDARRPPAGLSVVTPPPPPVVDPCYDPATLGRLEFTDPWANNGRLVFTCIRGGPGPGPDTVIVPIRSVYMTINTFSLVRLDNGFPIPATGMSLGLDVDSWTWNFSFSVNGDLMPFVEPNVNGDPVIVQATINGTPLRLLVEKIGRERTFGSSQLRCSGRGISAALDAPYAPVLSFNNTSARTVRQLLGDILTFNGVSIGWDIDVFDPTDWLVPTGVFSHSGTYISALNAVVGAAGAYLQPKDTANEMDVLLRYPAPAWEWSSATPDLILPSAVTSREAIEWVDKPIYDRVFVSGQQGGVSGRYTRAGTAGALLAPPVVDPLIAHADAVRQRGRAIISDTGRIASVTLRLPVLAETGIIRPGTMVQYTDGPVERIGLSRSVSVDVGMPTVYQNIEVETHVE